MYSTMCMLLTNIRLSKNSHKPKQSQHVTALPPGSWKGKPNLQSHHYEKRLLSQGGVDGKAESRLGGMT